MRCNHERQGSRWVEEENWYTGETEGRWEHYTESTTVDIDLHRYKCTQCGLVMYYSGRAKDHYEEGKKFNWIKGLE